MLDTSEAPTLEGAAKDSPPDAPHAVVIGAGFGGLAAAVRLQARGYRVTILERLDQPGGRAYVFHQDGFVFDAGPTIITAPFLLEELWQLAGFRLEDEVELREMNPFYRIVFDDGDQVDCSGDPLAMRAEVARLAPDDVAGYERFMAKSEEIFEIGFVKLGDQPFGSPLDMVKILPDLLRLSGHRSVHGLVSSYVRNEKLRVVLSFHPLLIGGNPFTASAVYCLISHLERKWGVHFAMGGTGKLASGLAGLVERRGGKLRYNSTVARILVEKGQARGVRLEDGEEIAADVVVSNAETAHTYRTLLAEVPRRRWSDRRLDRARYSMSLFVWYFGTDRRFEDVPHHTILLGPRYRELLTEIFEDKRLASDFSLYLHRPTATDPSLAPEGCDAFYVLSPVPHLDAEIDWHERAELYRQAIEARLESMLMPGLGQSIVSSRVMTPLDFRDRLLSERGAAFGLEPVLLQSAWFRAHNRSEEVKGLYLVGAGTHPGAGVPGVLSSARVLDKVVPHADELRRRS